MKYIVIEDPAFTVISPDAVLYERIESTPSKQEVPLAPRYRKVASGKSGQLQKLAKRLNAAEGEV